MDVVAVARDPAVSIAENGEGAEEFACGGVAEGEGLAEEALSLVLGAEEGEVVVCGWAGVAGETRCFGGLLVVVYFGVVEGVFGCCVRERELGCSVGWRSWGRKGDLTHGDSATDSVHRIEIARW